MSVITGIEIRFFSKEKSAIDLVLKKSMNQFSQTIGEENFQFYSDAIVERSIPNRQGRFYDRTAKLNIDNGRSLSAISISFVSKYQVVEALSESVVSVIDSSPDVMCFQREVMVDFDEKAVLFDNYLEKLIFSQLCNTDLESVHEWLTADTRQPSFCYTDKFNN